MGWSGVKGSVKSASQLRMQKCTCCIRGSTRLNESHTCVVSFSSRVSSPVVSSSRFVQEDGRASTSCTRIDCGMMA